MAALCFSDHDFDLALGEYFGVLRKGLHGCFTCLAYVYSDLDRLHIAGLRVFSDLSNDWRIYDFLHCLVECTAILDPMSHLEYAAVILVTSWLRSIR